jgi:ketosteroid isomerase-like protein
MGALLAQGTRPLHYELIAEGPRVVLLWRGEGVMRNGAPYHQSYCWVMDVRDGLITRLRAYLDTELVSALFDQGPADDDRDGV